MREIFSTWLGMGYSIEHVTVRESGTDTLEFEARGVCDSQAPIETGTATLCRDEIEELYQALGKWLAVDI
jgi:hypothetical protein